MSSFEIQTTIETPGPETKGSNGTQPSMTAKRRRKRRRKERALDKYLMSIFQDKILGRPKRMTAYKAMVARKREQRLQVGPDAIRILEKIVQQDKTETTLVWLARTTNLGPQEFSAAINFLSRQGLIHVRGASCRILLIEAEGVTQRTQRDNADLKQLWVSHLEGLTRREVTGRNFGHTDDLRVGTAPVRLTHQGQSVIWKLANKISGLRT